MSQGKRTHYAAGVGHTLVESPAVQQDSRVAKDAMLMRVHEGM